MEHSQRLYAKAAGLIAPILLAFGYFVLASGAILATRFGTGLASLWVASPLLTAYLVTQRQRSWIAAIVACGAASAAATTLFGFGGASALLFAAINMTESILAAWLMTRSPQRSGLDSLPEVAALILTAGLIAPAVTGAAAGWASHWISGAAVLADWTNWLAGHGLGAVAVLPIAMLVMRGETAGWYRSSGRWLQAEGVSMMAIVAFSAWVTFYQRDLPLLFLPILPVIGATFRFGRFGAAISLLIVALIGGASTLGGHGLIASIDGSAAFRLQFYQFYIAILVLITLPIAAELERRNQIYISLRQSEARYRLVTDNATDIVLNLAVDGSILYVSPSLRHLSGHDPRALIGTPAMALVHPDDLAEVRDSHLAALADAGNTQTVEFRGLLADGSYEWFESHTRALIGSDGRASGMVSATRNIARRKNIERQLTLAANSDPLTGLANRRAFNEALDREMAQRRVPSSLALFDIDHFKRINDRFGHDAGDKVLQTFSTIALAVARDGDVVARLGGEEFAILLHDAAVERAAQTCERLREQFATATTRLEDGSELQATVSAGVAGLSGLEDRGAALRIVDAALYDAKNTGRNRLSLAA